MFWDRFSELYKKEMVFMYNSNDIAERIKTTAKRKNIALKRLLSDTGLGANTMANMKTSMPKSDSLAKIADYLEVPVDYLLGRTDDPNQKPGETNIRFDEFEFAMHNETKDLSDEDKNMLLDMARILKNRVMEKNNSKE